MKIFKEVKTIQKVMCNLKECHNLRFLVSVIDREEKKKKNNIMFNLSGFVESSFV